MTLAGSELTFLWHDYETFGANPRHDRPSQFAAIRTDAQLNEIGEPIMMYCKPTPDFVPDPVSCLITGITPQHCLEHGLPEYQFAAKIEQELSLPNTVGVGYNTIRFDDEVTRFLFWRNLIDPYAREWQNGCARWDIIDLVRTAYALRPEGIHWPKHEDGSPSFRLEDLSFANGVAHESAHDALSDVRATIALARLIQQKHPKLFDFCLSLRQKNRVAQELRLPVTPDNARPFLHISGMFPPDRGCIAVMWPLAMHPTNKNELLAWDLSANPLDLISLNASDIKERLFTKTEQLPDGITRLPIKGIHLNRSPVVIGSLKTLSPDMADHWGINMQQAIENAYKAQNLPDMSAIWEDVFSRDTTTVPTDVDHDLYGGFIGNDDRRRLQHLRQLSPQELQHDNTGFDDDRLAELVFRYRARNFLETLNQQEIQKWRAHCEQTIINGKDTKSLTLEALQQQIETLSTERENQGTPKAERELAILEALYDYADMLAAF